MRSQTYPVPVDPRVALMIAGFDSAGQPISMRPGRFASLTDAWLVTSQTPTEVAGLLSVTRSLYCHGFYVYEFATVAVQQAFVALEAALAHRLSTAKDAGPLAESAAIRTSG